MTRHSAIIHLDGVSAASLISWLQDLPESAKTGRLSTGHKGNQLVVSWEVEGLEDKPPLFTEEEFALPPFPHHPYPIPHN